MLLHENGIGVFRAQGWWRRHQYSGGKGLRFRSPQHAHLLFMHTCWGESYGHPEKCPSADPQTLLQSNQERNTLPDPRH
uniref:Uncharacterized protein n=1 Tax=Knipowitschia caucasica TaxID=637954 RepID=A0AAV2JEZ9_KNICA